MAKKFQVLIEKGKDGYFIGEVPELPGCFSQGKTVEELLQNIREAIEVYLETQKENKVSYLDLCFFPINVYR